MESRHIDGKRHERSLGVTDAYIRNRFIYGSSCHKSGVKLQSTSICVHQYVLFFFGTRDFAKQNQHHESHRLSDREFKLGITKLPPISRTFSQHPPTTTGGNKTKTKKKQKRQSPSPPPLPTGCQRTAPRRAAPRRAPRLISSPTPSRRAYHGISPRSSCRRGRLSTRACCRWSPCVAGIDWAGSCLLLRGGRRGGRVRGWLARGILM